MVSTSFHLLLPRQFHNEMVQHAQSELPNECCGILAGRKQHGNAFVEVRYPLVNKLGSKTDFEADPFFAYKDSRQRGIEWLAVYHSHPTSPPVPSKKDLDRNFYGQSMMALIVGLADQEPVIRAWWLEETDFTEATYEIVD